MIHGKWYRGNEDLSVLEREIDEQDLKSWHLIIKENNKRVGLCSLFAYDDGFCIYRIEYKSKEILELIFKMSAAHLEALKKNNIYIRKDLGISGFGFTEYNNDVLKTDKASFSIHCKEGL